MQRGTADAAPETCECRQQIEKILASEVFRGSEILRRLLKYLAEQALEQPGHRPREQDIALHVFGRTEQDFDPQTDSSVRVHAGRLRAKLAEYAVGEGARDTIRVEMPRGTYQLVFRYRSVQDFGAAPEASSTRSPVRKALVTWPRRGWILGALGGTIFGGWLGQWFAGTRRARQAGPLAVLWRDYLRSGDAPLVIFSTPRFVGSHLSGMRYYDASTDAGSAIIDTYTGISEVFGIHALTTMFAYFGHAIQIRRGQSTTWDEARQRHLILLGGPEANECFGQLPPLQELVVKGPASHPHRGVGAIIVREPGSGEPRILWGPTERPYAFDFGVIALIPGLSPGRRAMILAGLTTLGTQAAAEFVCREQSAATLLAGLGVRSDGPVPDFEALIKVRGSGGVPVESRLIFCRIRKPDR